jgi:hypothetical protein
MCFFLRVFEILWLSSYAQRSDEIETVEPHDGRRSVSGDGQVEFG